MKVGKVIEGICGENMLRQCARPASKESYFRGRRGCVGVNAFRWPQ